MSNAVRELFRVKGEIEIKMRAARAELDAINKAIEVLRRAENQPSRVSAQRAPVPQSGEFLGLTLPDACRRVVGEDPMLPSEVRDILIQRGYVPRFGPGRLLTDVHITLTRLSKPGGDLARGTKDGKFAFHKPSKDSRVVPVNGSRTSSPIVI